MTPRSTHIIPSKLEAIGLFFVALVILAAGHTQDFMRSYGLASSTDVIRQTAKQAVGHGLRTLDHFTLTGALVTFGIWALVGLFCFGLVEGLMRIYRLVRDEHSLQSRYFIHPAAFTKRLFWKHLLRDIVLLVLTTVILAVVLYGFLSIVLPNGLHTDHSLLKLAAGGLSLYGGLLLLAASVRLVVQRRHIFG